MDIKKILNTNCTKFMNNFRNQLSEKKVHIKTKPDCMTFVRDNRDYNANIQIKIDNS